MEKSRIGYISQQVKMSVAQARCPVFTSVTHTEWNTVMHKHNPNIPGARGKIQESHREIYEWASLE